MLIDESLNKSLSSDAFANCRLLEPIIGASKPLRTHTASYHDPMVLHPAADVKHPSQQSNQFTQSKTGAPCPLILSQRHLLCCTHYSCPLSRSRTRTLASVLAGLDPSATVGSLRFLFRLLSWCCWNFSVFSVPHKRSSIASYPSRYHPLLAKECHNEYIQSQRQEVVELGIRQ